MAASIHTRLNKSRNIPARNRISDARALAIKEGRLKPVGVAVTVIHKNDDGSLRLEY